MIQPQRSQFAYELDEDINHGFTTAIRNNQVNLALQYLQMIIVELQAEVAELKAAAPAAAVAVETPKATTATTKRTAKKEDGAA